LVKSDNHSHQSDAKVSWDTSKAETRSTDEIFEEYRGLLGQPGLQAVLLADRLPQYRGRTGIENGDISLARLYKTGHRQRLGVRLNARFF
jgi:hypothetical protein